MIDPLLRPVGFCFGLVFGRSILFFAAVFQIFSLTFDARANDDLDFDDFDNPEISGAENEPEFGAPAIELPPNTRVEDVVEPTADYHYAGFGKPDPFTPPVFVRSIVPDAVEIPIVSPLQRFPLTALKLAGVWARGSGEKKALVLTPTQEGIIVKVGDMVGNGGGRIMSIAENSVVIREFLIANDGTRQFADSSLTFEDGFSQSPNASEKKGTILIKPGASAADVQLNDVAAGTAASGVGSANRVPANLMPAAPAGPMPASASGK